MDIMESFLYVIRVTSYPVTKARKNGIFLTGWQTLLAACPMAVPHFFFGTSNSDII